MSACRAGGRLKADSQIAVLPLAILVSVVLGHGDLGSIEDGRLCADPRLSQQPGVSDAALD